MQVRVLLVVMGLGGAGVLARTQVVARGGSASAVQRAAEARLEAPAIPLSAMARLGEKIFFDARLSGSGKMSCASCHDPGNAYAPANALATQMGGSRLRVQGIRAVPSLTYLERTPRFVLRLDTAFDPDEGRPAKASRLAAMSNAKGGARNRENALQGEPMVPAGGMDWDGRAATLAEQASGPLLDLREMANRDERELLAKLETAPYAGELVVVFGPEVFTSPSSGLADLYRALARYQMEDRSFHAYNSKFDYYLAGRAQLSSEEMWGLELFDDPKKGNCAACHLDKPTKNRLAPVFTDAEFEALGVPRNRGLRVNRDGHYFDEGLCGPLRKDAREEEYCGLFKTPTLRNVATRRVFFHNGEVHSLEDAVRFYVERETRPERWYPRRADGTVAMYDDLPAVHRANVDVTDAPFNRRRGEEPALSEEEIRDVVAFLKTLTDNYRATSQLGAQAALGGSR